MILGQENWRKKNLKTLENCNEVLRKLEEFKDPVQFTGRKQT